MKNPYEDILHLQRPRSGKRACMSMIDRAAQFSPFAALTGFDSAIEETGRLTDQKTELDASEQEILNRKQQVLMEAIASHPFVSVTYFLADPSKPGGAYCTVYGELKKIDPIGRVMVFLSGDTIPLDEILQIESPLLDFL